MGRPTVRIVENFAASYSQPLPVQTPLAMNNTEVNRSPLVTSFAPNSVGLRGSMQPRSAVPQSPIPVPADVSDGGLGRQPPASGKKMPALLYGTAWKKDETADLVLQALLAGFRGIDTACQPKHYREDLVGVALAQAKAQYG